MGKATILIVEDEAIVAADLAGKLGRLGYEISGTTGFAEDAVNQAREQRPDLVLMDIRLAGTMDGVEAAEIIRREFDLPVIFLTAHSDSATLERAKLTGPFGYILKPFEERELATNIEMALFKHRAEQKLRQAYDELEIRIQERTRELKDANESLERRVAERTAELQAANTKLLDSRRASLNMMEDAIAARRQAEEANAELQREVTEHTRTEEAMRQSEERYRSLFNTLMEGFCVIEVLFDAGDHPIDYRFLECNPAFEAQTGLRYAQGKLMRELAPEHEEHWFEIYGKVALTGEPARFVNEAKALNRWYEVSAYQVEGRDSHKVAILFNDITEAKRAEQALQESELFFRQTLESIPGMVFTTRPDGYCDYQSQQWVDFTGVPMVEHLGDGWNKLLHPDDRPRAFAAWHAAVEGHAPYDLEYRVRRHDSIYEWFKVRGRPIRDAAGRIVRWFGTALNIDYLVQTQEALRQQEERLRLALTAAQMASWDWNIASGDVVWNDTHYWMMGYEPGEVQPSYHAWANRVHPDDREATQQLIEQCMVERRLYTAEFRTLWPDGTIRWLEARGDFEYDANNQPLRNYGVMLDITDRKRSEEDLRRAKETAEAATLTKSLFLANMSHELRTPMTGVIGMLDLVLTGNLEKEQQECIEIAQTSACSLVRLLNDILDLTKVEMGKFSMEENPLSIRQCVETTYNILLPVARSKGLAFVLTVADDVPEALIGDQVRLNQVLTNLAGNAVKFTEKGEVAIRVVAGGSTPEGKRLITFTVADTGIGIADDKQHLLFGVFSQVDASHSRSYGGSGLGLAISREIVDRMGGTIGFSSEAGKGSTFYCTIPLTETDAFLAAGKTAAARIVPVPEVERKARLLIAEDDQVVSQVLSLMFKRAQFDVDLVDSGHKVIEKWEAGHYDMILMDVQMPLMNGFEATAAIRERERTRGGHIPIIAMTAHALKEDKDRCLAAGMDSYISKPIDFKKSVQLIEDFLKKSES